MKQVRVIVDAKPSMDMMEIPSYGIVEVTEDTLAHLKARTELCKEHELSEAREFRGIEWFDEEQYRIDLEEFCYDQNDVWVNAFIKHSDAAFYTSRITVSKLETMFEAASDGDIIYEFCENPIDAENMYEDLLSVE